MDEESNKLYNKLFERNRAESRGKKTEQQRKQSEIKKKNHLLLQEKQLNSLADPLNVNKPKLSKRKVHHLFQALDKLLKQIETRQEEQRELKKQITINQELNMVKKTMSSNKLTQIKDNDDQSPDQIPYEKT